MSANQERRAYARISCEIPVLIISDGFSWPGTMLDYSEGGAFIASTLQPGISGELGFRFERPTDSTLIEIQGVVRRITGSEATPAKQLRFGVQFSQLLSEAPAVKR